MKKLLLPAALVAFVFAGTSCTKDYVCTCDLGILGETSQEYPGLNKEEADAAEAACTTGNICTWSEA